MTTQNEEKRKSYRKIWVETQRRNLNVRTREETIFILYFICKNRQHNNLLKAGNDKSLIPLTLYKYGKKENFSILYTKDNLKPKIKIKDTLKNKIHTKTFGSKKIHDSMSLHLIRMG